MTDTRIESEVASKKTPVDLDATIVAGIGRRIREIRGALNQDDFCKLIGLQKRTLVRYESEKTYPSAETVAKICHEFGVNPAWLLFGHEGSNLGAIPPVSKVLRRSA
jgi:transcriptional regulator with XRE-family HTH domain